MLYYNQKITKEVSRKARERKINYEKEINLRRNKRIRHYH